MLVREKLLYKRRHQTRCARNSIRQAAKSQLESALNGTVPAKIFRTYTTYGMDVRTEQPLKLCGCGGGRTSATLVLKSALPRKSIVLSGTAHAKDFLSIITSVISLVRMAMLPPKRELGGESTNVILHRNQS
mmetsp:Transcript_17493/g.28936  ORF Transcript_17493/g.28936 Transcript_17493/m.28936 type:complete len:132 (-) Transcript_17493:1101-1496(-)